MTRDDPQSGSASSGMIIENFRANSRFYHSPQNFGNIRETHYRSIYPVQRTIIEEKEDGVQIFL